jgi:hypothetical protein
VRLLAISDLHVRHKANRAAVEALPACPEDWLILAGDLGETLEQVRWVFRTLKDRFARLLWVPGNHELWWTKDEPLRGQAKYDALVACCREEGVLSPEDPWAVFDGDGGPVTVALLFVLYDYSLAPPGLDVDGALAWAREHGLMCTDEWRLDPQPLPSRVAWSDGRIALSEARLGALPPDVETVLVNHWPLHPDLVRLPAIPRFRIWCGTERTRRWHVRYRARAAVAGHLHLRSTDWRDGTRFEEVSLGYPRHWHRAAPPGRYLREILPGPARTPRDGGPVWHR